MPVPEPPRIHAVHRADHAAIAELPWHLPLKDWPEQFLGGLPRGISRHVVRFVEIGDEVLAIKETEDDRARREFDILGVLGNLDVPTVETRAIVTNRVTDSGQPLPGALITAYLDFSLPYRALFSRSLAEDTTGRLVDALAVLLARLHLVGFYWGDVSLSNTLFRRDADAYAAYVVDAETGELHDQLSPGQREMDLRIARTNIAGDFLDLQAGGVVDPGVDPLAASDRLLEAYNGLWAELTRVEEFAINERWRIDERIRRLNDLGFDLGELTVTTDLDGVSLLVEPKVVEPNHHSRRLLRLTGIGANENQARAMLNDLDAYRSEAGADERARAGADRSLAASPGFGGAHGSGGSPVELSEEEAARIWLAEVYKPLIDAIPGSLANKLEPAQIFYEFVEHRRAMAHARQRDVPFREAIAYFIMDDLAKLPDESRYVDSRQF
ncbi:lipopolysaccharide kinase (Kdo/WaaP) family protein [Brevibacterium sanguinis]|uniref:Lipopolysaccharide kinase (Kdo/WaaP) family protein n=2 Tax=Brevibacterium TaxID=1696 RepID=A0A366IKS1_9MICO|nr:lipopolysaccharide kinase (Kdo/WaaP) family protein [Brevibacterium sanguinis]RBP72188.1 lipopolysaccharide kinase (Kdo/WaaP) family protein [Brevibacterium celere]